MSYLERRSLCLQYAYLSSVTFRYQSYFKLTRFTFAVEMIPKSELTVGKYLKL